MKMGYGWRPDVPDGRDRIYNVSRGVALPDTVDLRPYMPAIYNQGSLGSCTANAIAALLDYQRGREGKIFINPSRLFIYFFERRLEGAIESDAGAEIRNGIKVVLADGAPPESEWAYDDGPIRFKLEPELRVQHDAKEYQAIEYLRLAEDGQSFHYRHALAESYPVVFGFSVYDSFESDEIARTGIMSMPDFDRESLQGGHAVLGVGYITNNKLPSQLSNGAILNREPGGGYAIVRNSWGRRWGLDGYFFMPFSYLFDTNLTADFWTIKKVE